MSTEITISTFYCKSFYLFMLLNLYSGFQKFLDKLKDLLEHTNMNKVYIGNLGHNPFFQSKTQCLTPIRILIFAQNSNLFQLMNK